MASGSVYDEDLEAARAKMADIEENLKSLTGGRLIIPASRRGGPRGGMMRGGPGRMFNSAREESGGNANLEPMRKRMRPGLEGRLGSAPKDYDDPDPPARVGGIASSVMMPVRETKSRDDAINELQAEEPKEVKSRNRRMFGMLLGTLSGFRKSVKREDKLREQEKKREEVEKKLENEKQQLREQREADKTSLLAARQEQEEEIFRLQRRRMTTFIAEKEIAHLRLLQPFIQTKAKPPIFYRPKQHSLRTIELQKKTAKKLEELIQQKQEKLTGDLATIDEKNAMYKSRIPGLKRDAKDEADGDTIAASSEKEPGEVGETIDGDAPEGAETAPDPGSENGDDKDTTEVVEKGTEEEVMDEGADIIEAINTVSSAVSSALPPSDPDKSLDDGEEESGDTEAVD